MEINGTEIDFSKQRGYFFQMDCMDALKQMPDKCIDLCICDPPYGDGIAESSQICQVERERDGEAVEQVRRKVRQVQDAEHTTHSDFGRRTRITRTGGTWAEKYAKKSFRGTQPQKKSIFKSFFVSHGIK